MIALGRRKTDTSCVVNACAAAPARTSRQLVADLIGAPVHDLDATRHEILEVTHAKHNDHVRACLAYDPPSAERVDGLSRALRTWA